jgi:hypothetical protein
MRHARFSLEEQVGGLVDEERYVLRRPASGHAPLPEPLPRPADRPRRPLTIRASRVDGTSATHAA